MYHEKFCLPCHMNENCKSLQQVISLIVSLKDLTIEFCIDSLKKCLFAYNGTWAIFSLVKKWKSPLMNINFQWIKGK